MARPGNKIIQAKLVLLGDMGTGKTSIALRFVKGHFFPNQEPTIGAAFFTQILSLSEATVKFDIWDTAGQERYHSLAPMYYRGAAAAIVVYDISSVEIEAEVVLRSSSYPASFFSLGIEKCRSYKYVGIFHFLCLSILIQYFSFFSTSPFENTINSEPYKEAVYAIRHYLRYLLVHLFLI
ncbi:hypothetical protein JHK87_038197 [Glycine soja]|nr:hypothetical protein JHK87_038197 [Glycine soja]